MRGGTLPRAPDGEELIFEDEVVGRIRVGGSVKSRTVSRRQRHGDDEFPIVAEHYRTFVAGGRKGP
ncbi:MAG: hypothetical protein Kow0092_05340 [Deferrisomatales bacterium]